MYQFLSGYTAKVAGTERGIKEPTPVFSACYGEAFLPLHPSRYAELLKEKLETHDSQVYLVNTGWTGGPYGVGERISITETRACVRAILTGAVETATYAVDPTFGFEVPTKISNVRASILVPRESWQSPTAYDIQAERLARQFKSNYEKFVVPGGLDYSRFGPK